MAAPIMAATTIIPRIKHVKFILVGLVGLELARQSRNLGTYSKKGTSVVAHPNNSDDTEEQKGEYHDVSGDSVLDLDEASIAAASWTHYAQSKVEWMEQNGNEVPIKAIPVAATVDRRPSMTRIQKNQSFVADETSTIGCVTSSWVALTPNRVMTFIFRGKHAAKCSLCYRYTQEDPAFAFARMLTEKKIWYVHDKYTNEVCVSGNARFRVSTATMGWQRKKYLAFQRNESNNPRDLTEGYPWGVSCRFKNIEDLTCDRISSTQKSILQNETLQSIHLKTNLTLTTVSGERLNVQTEWPWAALMTQNDRVNMALPKNASDKTSPFIPVSDEDVSILFMEGPVWSLKNKFLKTNVPKGLSFRLFTNLIHQAKQAPKSTRLIGVHDGQFQSAAQELKRMLEMKIEEIVTQCWDFVRQIADLSIGDTAVNMSCGEFSPRDISWTLRDLLAHRQVRIRLVAFPMRSELFSTLRQAGQDAFAPWASDRFAADYQALVYADSDAIPVARHNIPFSKVIHSALFESHCAQRQMTAFELPLENGSVDEELSCTQHFLLDSDAWEHANKNCSKFYGHVIARVDSLGDMGIHKTHSFHSLTPGVRKCFPGPLKLRSGWMAEIHIRNKIREFDVENDCMCPKHSSSLVKLTA